MLKKFEFLPNEIFKRKNKTLVILFSKSTKWCLDVLINEKTGSDTNYSTIKGMITFELC